MPKYSIVIPTYNNCEKYLKPCVDSILKYSKIEDIELIISYNGCTDNTKRYLNYLISCFEYHGFGHQIKFFKSEHPLGFAKAVNRGIEMATCDKIVLLNNDTVILGDKWLEKLDTGDISAVWTQYSQITKRRFAVFFCVMIDRKVFNKIGLLNEEYGTGGCEDIEFCLKAEEAGFKIHANFDDGSFPIYHKAEGTVHDTSLVQDWDNKFLLNELKLAKKYNKEWYYWRLSNNYERAVFLKGDPVFPRETQRYEWAAQNLFGVNSLLEIGCSTGYGVQFLPERISYLGLDYDPIIVDVAKDQNWRDSCSFDWADINNYELSQYDAIVAFEVVEHLDNGLEIVEKLKQHCKRLLITVPHNEPKGFWGEHHKLHGLTEKDFPGFQFVYINEAGIININPQPINETNRANLMICRWDNE
jgi:glycosyltransferase involved in cell wall biosynthesis